MSDSAELIWLIRSRYELNSEELERYYNLISKIIEQTATSLKIKYDSFDLMSVSSIITKDGFINQCWDLLEGEDDNDKRLIDMLQNLEFKDDNSLKSYIKKAFENLFLDSLNKISPEFQTRQKQVSRVMQKLCVKIRGNNFSSKGELWQLKEYQSSSCQTMTLEELKMAASNFKIPAITYPKSEDAQRGGSIKDEDMQNYMVQIFCAAGGAIYKKDIDGLIAHLFCSNQMNLSTSDGYGNQNYEDRENYGKSVDILSSKDLVMPSFCYTAIAQQTIDTMDREMRDIIYLIYVKEVDQGQVAKIVEKSEGYVSKIKQKIQKHITDYIKNGSYQFSYQEGKIIFRLILELIAEIKEVSYL
ncbi:MAG: hypothetical protein HQK64_13335 [Desulfamplus sp.]|nr:hypothetical protein [Desulfamplus sp.]